MIYNVGTGYKAVTQGCDNSVRLSSGGPVLDPRSYPVNSEVSLSFSDLRFEAHRRPVPRASKQEAIKSF